MSRPEIPIDWRKVDELLIAGCSGVEVAAYFAMHPQTFYDRVSAQYKVGFTEYLQEKRSKGDSLLRAKQYAKAMGFCKDGDNTMLVWLGKNRLEQREPEAKTISIPNDGKINDLLDFIKQKKENDSPNNLLQQLPQSEEKKDSQENDL